MKFMADIQIKSPAERIGYNDSIFLIGSCFTEHIGNRLAEVKFPVHQNPNGILFDPVSVCRSLQSYLVPQVYNTDDLFYHNELWQSWHHHSMFSGTNAQAVVDKINQCQQAAHRALQQATWMVITLGSAFTYHLKENNQPVANCHRAPAGWFDKTLTPIETIIRLLTEVVEQVQAFNPGVNIIFTISPVRHLRDGITDNNRSKARLIEAVHHVGETFGHCHYFPAYELVIDVLRDYRFFDVDLAHPNYAATAYVFERFTESFISAEAATVMDEIRQVTNAFKHKAFQPDTDAHKRFLAAMLQKVEDLQQRLPQLSFAAELSHFGQSE